MPRDRRSPKLAITVDPDVHEDIFAAGARDGVGMSAWITDAAPSALQRRAGLEAVELWEKKHGRFSLREMDRARGRVREQLGVPRNTPS